MATWKGLEPSTSSVTGWHSNQLNYQAAMIKLLCHLIAFMKFLPSFFKFNWCQLEALTLRILR